MLDISHITNYNINDFKPLHFISPRDDLIFVTCDFVTFATFFHSYYGDIR